MFSSKSIEIFFRLSRVIIHIQSPLMKKHEQRKKGKEEARATQVAGRVDLAYLCIYLAEC